MIIIPKKSFLKDYAKLKALQRERVDWALRSFLKNPKDPVLRNHGLKGNLAGKQAISAGFDLRIVFKVEGDYIRVLMLSVGTHNQVY
jgi:addiction module RelE/StbE family toxin